ncbi:hypothetical protein ACS126_18485 [Sphingobacterium lactis]|uniref:hypothetical protein n=1 Tax=Sphingobacterium lactis TaxID=797291 RepID=UPI003EC5A5BF
MSDKVQESRNAVPAQGHDWGNGNRGRTHITEWIMRERGGFADFYMKRGSCHGYGNRGWRPRNWRPSE